MTQQIPITDPSKNDELALTIVFAKIIKKALAQLISFERHSHQSSKLSVIKFTNFQTILARHGKFDIFDDRYRDHGLPLFARVN